MQKIAAAALLAVFLPLSLSASLAAAADATTPVKVVMDATVSNWAGGDSDWQDIFDDSKLKDLYSKDFVAKYQAAAQFPAADEDGISPFDYDVIVGGQDACPLQDLNIAPQVPKGDTTEVIATFKKSTCMGTDADYQGTTTVRFEVVQEAGKPVIDDIVTVDDAGQSNSLKSAMQDIVKQQQQQQPAEQTQQDQPQQ
jgi:opacity protein-like surface antigen